MDVFTIEATCKRSSYQVRAGQEADLHFLPIDTAANLVYLVVEMVQHPSSGHIDRFAVSIAHISFERVDHEP